MTASYSDLSDQPNIGDVQSPPAESLRPEPEPAEEAEKKKPFITIGQIGDYIGQDVWIRGALASAKVGETKHGKAYVGFELMDREGSIEGRIWDASELPAEVGTVVGFLAKVDEFNGQPQIIVEFVKPLPDEDPADYVRASHLFHEELCERLDGLLQCVNGEYGEVVRSVFGDDELRAAFLAAPAAKKNHHAYERGLAEHTLSMAGLADGVIEHYRKGYSDPIDRDLVLAGILLHDLGKAIDFERDGLAWSVGIEGELVGHIPECATLIHDACMATAASDDTRRRLLHVVLAHHGKIEWGSPVTPKLVEAQIVHQVDMIDSRMAMHREATKGLERGEISGWVRPLGGRVLR